MATVKQACVYVLRAGPMCHKIGFTTNLGARIATLQTASPHRLELVGYVASPNAVAIERRVHFALEGRRIGGEWFAVSGEQAVAAVHDEVRLAARHRFAPGNLVRCVAVPSACPGPLPIVGKHYTVERVYPGWQIDLAFLNNSEAAFDPTCFHLLPPVYIGDGEVI